MSHDATPPDAGQDSAAATGLPAATPHPPTTPTPSAAAAATPAPFTAPLLRKHGSAIDFTGADTPVKRGRRIRQYLADNGVEATWDPAYKGILTTNQEVRMELRVKVAASCLAAGHAPPTMSHPNQKSEAWMQAHVPSLRNDSDALAQHCAYWTGCARRAGLL